MKPTPKSQPDLAPILAFGAHPDDIEFGCGGVIAYETSAGRGAHFVICSRGEAGTNGTPAKRTAEAKKSAKILGATVEFVDLDGDAHLDVTAAHAIKLAGVIRRIKPGFVLAPTPVENQHPDHAHLGQLVRNAARLARYGGVKEIADPAVHAIDQLFFYAVTPEGEPPGTLPVVFDVSASKIIATWTSAMKAHASQAATRKYVDLQLARARVRGLQAGVEHAIALFPNDPLVIHSLISLKRSARAF